MFICAHTHIFMLAQERNAKLAMLIVCTIFVMFITRAALNSYIDARAMELVAQMQREATPMPTTWSPTTMPTKMPLPCPDPANATNVTKTVYVDHFFGNKLHVGVDSYCNCDKVICEGPSECFINFPPEKIIDNKWHFYPVPHCWCPAESVMCAINWGN